MSCAPDCDHPMASCCEGSDPLVPEAKDNPPGQSSLRYRVGTYASFFETMLARLMNPPEQPQACETTAEGEAAGEPDPFGLEPDGRRRWPLRALTVRDPSDPTLAMLDAWAMVGDVLTFYTERIANEGTLRTATELRSVQELARLVGHRPRPGVAASVDLAFTLESGQTVEIPAGTRAQSLPQPGELPQAYETMEPLVASADRNAMRPLQARFRAPDWNETEPNRLVVYLEGATTNLKLNDVVLAFGRGEPGPEHLFRVDEVEPLPNVQQTRVLLRTHAPDQEVELDVNAEDTSMLRELLSTFGDLGEREVEWSERLRTWSDRDVLEHVGSDRVLRESLRRALEEAKASRPAPLEFHVFRASSPLFGHNATFGFIGSDGELELWPITGTEDEADDRLFVDAANERVRPDSFVVLDRWPRPLLDGEVEDEDQPSLSVHRVLQANIRSRSAYGLAKTALELELGSPWIDWSSHLPAEFPTSAHYLAQLRRVMVHLESEPLPVARRPLDALEGNLLELEGLHFDLDPGRTLIVEGEDEAAPGARYAERVVVQSVVHDFVDVSTRVTLAEPLQHRFVREHTTIHGNVARATQGESRSEVLGSGDASTPSKTFTLRHAPLTHVPAATVTGVESTLTVRVNGVEWPEAPVQALLGPRDRKVVTRTDDEGRTVVVGGDGHHGARFPTGQDNLEAEYRSGQGPSGNVDPGQITMLATRPFGVQKVTNPIAASGGAGPDGIEDIRERAPLAVMAFDRLVSVRDHEDFALRFAGIAKARAHRVGSAGVHARWRVRTVVAGIEPKPLVPDSELLVRLREAMERFGDPSLERELVPATLQALSITAKVVLAPGYAWHELEPRLRTALHDRLGYDQQKIGQAIHPSHIVTIMQGVPGVAFVDLDEIAIAGTKDDEPLVFGLGDVIPPDPDAVRFVDVALPETLDLTEHAP